MAKTRKVLDINEGGKHFVCIRDNEKGVFKLYDLYWGTNKYGYPAEKRELIDEFFMFSSVLSYLTDFSVKINWGFLFITKEYLNF